MNLNIIRAVVFLVAGLILTLLPGKILEMERNINKKLNTNFKTKKTTIVLLGFIFLLISAVFFII